MGGDADTAAGVAARSALTHDEAVARSAVISDVHYAVELDLTVGDRTFATTTVVGFHSSSGGARLELDFTGEVESVDCNGHRSGPDAHDGRRVRLDVREGWNSVRVSGSASYSHTGEGLHRFRDPLDGNVYVHTKFEPFAAHTVFACFDQPDLKATVDLTLTVDPSWVVVSNTDPVESPTVEGGDRSTWRFERMPPLPTYLVAFAAGPFRVLRSRHRDVPLALYARPSLYDELTAEAPEVFDVIRRGLDFYGGLFDLPYQFAKYDHVFAPEYAFGGMEHPGCVTLNERFLFRNRVTEDARRRRASLLTHEMAHMWFGDYVTMRWWDDLWLNEAFATMLAVVAQPEATAYGEGWTSFAHHDMPLARRADQLPTRHAIRVGTADTDAARSNFGPIVYRRGAAVLRDLAERVGWENFVVGMRAYLQTHAWGNAGLDDFVAALRRVSDEDLDRWVDEWLLRPGVNTVEVCRGDGGDRVVQQSDPGVDPRHLTLRIAAFDYRDSALVPRTPVHVSLGPPECEHVLAEFDGPAPDLLLPNADAVSHVKTRLDSRSRRAALRSLSAVDDPRARAVMWGALWDEVQDALLSARSYASAVLAHGTRETDVGILEALLERASRALRVYGDPATGRDTLEVLARSLREHLVCAAGGSDRQLAFARALVGVVRSDDHGLLGDIVCGRPPWAGLEADRDLRWRALLRLAETGGDIDDLVDIAMEADPGDYGRRNALTAEAAWPSPAAKEKAWTRLFSGDHSLAERQAIMAGLRQPGQETLLTPFADRYWQALEYMAGTAETEFLSAFARALYPCFTDIEQSVLDETDRFLARKPLPESVLKVVREERAELLTIRAARACDAADAQD
ncbi:MULTISPECIES: aminopeptidase N [Prauserella salsuginis group]|uniref:Aminopeptidase N n=1 Tax=Prauserella salsuginis TaxID=387889 RepID=A0ABW6GC03_9PSEU|nr:MULTISPECIES: aminopeptidase N [Prauserella salsuginis group]MCR3718049.1 aminopeptidase N [Prauserella flava]MCR3732618.1 aminopeptidase N [Prauserella salsuginis]